MCENTRIEETLWDFGYKTERIDGVVNVRDPVHSSLPNLKMLVMTGYQLVKIKSLQQAIRFINERR